MKYDVADENKSNMKENCFSTFQAKIKEENFQVGRDNVQLQWKPILFNSNILWSFVEAHASKNLEQQRKELFFILADEDCRRIRKE